MDDDENIIKNVSTSNTLNEKRKLTQTTDNARAKTLTKTQQKFNEGAQNQENDTSLRNTKLLVKSRQQSDKNSENANIQQIRYHQLRLLQMVKLHLIY